MISDLRRKIIDEAIKEIVMYKDRHPYEIIFEDQECIALLEKVRKDII
jgi:hypothetical protein